MTPDREAVAGLVETLLVYGDDPPLVSYNIGDSCELFNRAADCITTLLSELERVGKERDEAQALVAEAVQLLTGLVPPPGFREARLMNVDRQIPVDMHLPTIRAARAFIEKAKS